MDKKKNIHPHLKRLLENLKSTNKLSASSDEIETIAHQVEDIFEANQAVNSAKSQLANSYIQQKKLYNTVSTPISSSTSSQFVADSYLINSARSSVSTALDSSRKIVSNKSESTQRQAWTRVPPRVTTEISSKSDPELLRGASSATLSSLQYDPNDARDIGALIRQYVQAENDITESIEKIEEKLLKVEELNKLNSDNIQKTSIKHIEILGVFSAVLALIISGSTVSTQSTSVGAACIILGSVSLCMMLLISCIDDIAKDRQLFSSNRQWVILYTIFVFIIFGIIYSIFYENKFYVSNNDSLWKIAEIMTK